MRCRRAFTLGSVIVAAAVLPLVAGCGGSGSSTTTAGSTSAAQNGALAFARCMRAHGFSGWPDPTSNGTFDKATMRRLGYSKARVQAVEQSACGRYLPANGPSDQAQQRARLADGLSFARCMRSHGVTQFPDPDAQGELTVAMVQAQGIDIRSPAVLQTVQECLPASHGALTAAKVRQALREAGAG